MDARHCESREYTELRVLAIRALHAIGDRQALPLLEQLAEHDGCDEVRQAARMAAQGIKRWRKVA